MGDTGLELTSRAQVRPNPPVLLGFGALRSAQVRSNCYQNCYQAHAIRGAGIDLSHALLFVRSGRVRSPASAIASIRE